MDTSSSNDQGHNERVVGLQGLRDNVKSIEAWTNKNAKNGDYDNGQKLDILDPDDVENIDKEESTSKEGGSTGHEKVTMMKNITVLHGTCIVVSTIIGSGIFVSPNKITKNVGSPAMSILLWLGGGILSTIGAITFCELGTMLPQNGGTLIYLRKAYGPLMSFLSCWLLHVLLGGLRRAIQFLTFSKFFLDIFFEDGKEPWYAEKLICIAVLGIVLGVISVYPTLTLKIIDIVTLFKLGSVFVIIVIGAVELAKGNTDNISVGFNGTIWEPQKWGDAWNNVLWSYNGWISICIMLGEVKDPKVLPKIVALSMSVVTTVYILAVISYHTVLPMSVMQSNEPLANELAMRTIGKGGKIFFTIAVAVSTLGNSMCTLLAASRFLQAGGSEGLLPSCFSLINKKFRTPLFSLLFVAITACIFIMIGNVFQLISTASFTSYAFTTLCSIGLIVMRYTLPNYPRPLKVNLIFPILSTLIGLYVFIIPWFTRWEMCVLWTLLTLLGVPVYYFVVRDDYRPLIFTRASAKFTEVMSKLLNSE